MMDKEKIKVLAGKIVSTARPLCRKVYVKGKEFARKHRQFSISFGIIAAAVFAVFVMVALRQPPERVKKEVLDPLVKVQHLAVRDIQMTVSGHGTVSPKVIVEIVPQVSGKVVYVNQKFKAGGFVPAGEKLMKIEARDYELDVQQARAGVAEAMVGLDTERAEGQVAKQEWEKLYPGQEPSSPLVFRKPQIRQALAKLESAKAQLATAELNLERTEVFLPVDVRIDSEAVDLGQYVTAGKAVGAAYGIEAVEIELPIKDEELAWFNVSEGIGLDETDKKTTAVVKADFAGAKHIWEGFVARTTGKVDTKSRFVSVVIEVVKPFDTSASKTALLPGMFVEVFIKGKILKNAVAVPRDAVHNGNEIWVVNDGRLYIKQLKIARFDGDFAYVTEATGNKTMIVISSMDTVTNGMRVRTAEEDD